MSLSTIAGYCALMVLSALSIFWLTGKAARFALSWSRRRAMRALIRERQSQFLPPNPARERAKRALDREAPSGEELLRAAGFVTMREIRERHERLMHDESLPLIPGLEEVVAQIEPFDLPEGEPLKPYAGNIVVAAHDGLSYLSDWASGTVTASNGTTSTTLGWADGQVAAQISAAYEIPATPFPVSRVAHMFPRLCSAETCSRPRAPGSVYCETHARAAERST